MKSLIVLILVFLTNLTYSQGIVINEIMSSNNSVFYDDDGDTPDWLELYNSGTSQLNLLGYYLSDDSLLINKWQFGEVSVEPGAYLVVFASDKDTNMTYWHTNFKISADGEQLILSDPNGTIVDQVYVPASLTDISYGRISDGAAAWSFQTPSPGSANTGQEIAGLADSVHTSIPPGFYNSSISIGLSAGTSEIYFTLDGSDPGMESSKYSGPVNISATTILKAVSFKEGYLPSPVAYYSYIINENTNLPVISLSTDPDNLFDSDSGIFINYEEDWEKPAHVEFFEDDKSLGFSENVGINIYGGYTRRFAQKSLGVKFKSKYGKNELDYDLFPGFSVKTFKSFIMRNSGNDFEQTHIRDAFMQTLVKDLDIDYLEYRPAVTFINGEYWGIYNIREKISEHYIANRHGVDPDNIDMMDGYSAYNDDENDPDGEYGLWVGNLEAVHGDTVNYKQLIDYLYTQDLTTDAAYNFINSMIDLDECLLYYAAQVYYNSQDWPANNSKYWRERSPEGRWRWILFDLDFGFNLYEWNNEGNSEDHVNYLFSGDPSQRPQSKPVESTFIPRKLVENPKIKIRFINQVADLLNSNFKTDRVLNIMNNIADHIADDIGRHRERFGLRGDNLDRLISFAQQRPDYLRGHVSDFFDCGIKSQININSIEGGGTVKVNSLSVRSMDIPWSGLYFMQNPVPLKAIPDKGYKFDGWTGAVNSVEDSIEIIDDRTAILSAYFSVDSTTANEIVINEINYNSAETFNTGDWIELFNRSGEAVDIGGWYFSDSDTAHKYIMPAGTILSPGEYLVLVENDSAFTANFPGVLNYLSETGFGLEGAGEFIQLVNDGGKIVDSLTYDDAAPWPAEADGLGSTLELIDPVRDNSAPGSWIASPGNGTPGKANSTLTDVNYNISSQIPDNYSLSQNYPNPFNPKTNIKYSIPKHGYISLKVYNQLGQEISIIFEGYSRAGVYEVVFDGTGLASGVYFYRLLADDYAITKKLILLK